MKRKKPILYIDVDGVLLTTETGDWNVAGKNLRPFASDLLVYATRHFQPRWLTGWYLNQRKNRLNKLYEDYLKDAGVHPSLFAKIHPHKWKFNGDLFIDKLNSIDCDEDFYIVDDDITDFRIPIEFRHRFIAVHPTKRNDLKRVIAVLGRIVDGTEIRMQEMRMQIEGLKKGQRALLEGAKTILFEYIQKCRKKEMAYQKEVGRLREELRAVHTGMA